MKRVEFPQPITVEVLEKLNLGKTIAIEYIPNQYPLIKAAEIEEAHELAMEQASTKALVGRAASCGFLLEIPEQVQKLSDIHEVSFDLDKEIYLGP